MRTTITLDGQVLDQLKARAAESGGSVSRLVEHAVRLFLGASRAEESEEAFELVTFGAGGRFSPRNLDKTSALLETEDLERYGSRR